uniref:Uncharacterized protein n=1 Tax=Rhizophora mucronata TaxID=61149 RepID=A0A2P2PM19_RHIMU
MPLDFGPGPVAMTYNGLAWSKPRTWTCNMLFLGFLKTDGSFTGLLSLNFFIN